MCSSLTDRTTDSGCASRGSPVAAAGSISPSSAVACKSSAWLPMSVILATSGRGSTVGRDSAGTAVNSELSVCAACSGVIVSSAKVTICRSPSNCPAGTSRIWMSCSTVSIRARGPTAITELVRGSGWRFSPAMSTSSATVCFPSLSMKTVFCLCPIRPINAPTTSGAFAWRSLKSWKSESTGRTASIVRITAAIRSHCAADSTRISMFCASTGVMAPYSPISGLTCSETCDARVLSSGIVIVTIMSGVTPSGSPAAPITGVGIRTASFTVDRYRKLASRRSATPCSRRFRFRIDNASSNEYSVPPMKVMFPAGAAASRIIGRPVSREKKSSTNANGVSLNWKWIRGSTTGCGSAACGEAA